MSTWTQVRTGNSRTAYESRSGSYSADPPPTPGPNLIKAVLPNAVLLFHGTLFTAPYLRNLIKIAAVLFMAFCPQYNTSLAENVPLHW